MQITPEIHRYLLHYLKGRGYFDAEDIAQQTYINAMTRGKPFDGRVALSTWLVAIAINTAREIKNHEEVRTRNDPKAARTEPFESPAAEFERAESLNVLRARIDALPENARQVADMYFLQDYDYADMVALGFRKGTIGSGLSRARASLRGAYEAR